MGFSATLLKELMTVGAVDIVTVARLAHGRMGDPLAALRGHKWG